MLRGTMRRATTLSFQQMKKTLIFLWQWLKETFIHFFFKDNCPLMAAAISFYAILSLIPLFLLLISLSGFCAAFI